MSQSRVKRIRKEVYGEDYSPRFRQYERTGKEGSTIIADPKRQIYQLMKKK